MKYPSEEKLKAYRPRPFYFITTQDPAELTYEAAYEELSKMKAIGMGGFVLFNKPPYGFDEKSFLSESWFDMAKNFVKAAADLDLVVWLNDGFDYPPGDAGRRITKEKYPKLAQKHLVLEDGKVVVREAEWGDPAFEEPESAQLLQEFCYDPYVKAVGEYFGTTVKGVFSDADNRRVNANVFQDDSLQKDYFPWASDFAETFQETYGYDITPFLPAILAGETTKETGDYWEHAGFRYQGWFASNYRWCKEHGLEYTFHTSDSSPFTWKQAPRSSIYTEGCTLDMELNCDWPGTDQELLELNGGKHLRKEEYWVPKSTWAGDDSQICNPEYRNLYGDLRNKLAQSAAFLGRKKGVMCEMFAASNWGANFIQLREIAARQILQGVNFIVPHAYHHRLLGETKYFAPPMYNANTSLVKGFRQFFDDLTACCYYASQGEYLAPVAVLDITRDIWEGHEDTDTYFRLCLELDRLPHGYVIVDEKRLLEQADRFKVVIHAGRPLTAEQEAAFRDKGLVVLHASQLQELDKYVPCDVTYEGEGTPYFMRRRLDDGSTLVVMTSIEQGDVIHGKLTVSGQIMDVVLYPGEIAFYTKDGRMYHEEAPACEAQGIALASKAPVVWEKENIVTLDWWLDENGKAATKSSETSVLRLPYTVAEDLPQVSFQLPKRYAHLISRVLADGKELSSVGSAWRMDDEHLVYAVPANAGSHELTVEKTEALCEREIPMYLAGEFNVSVETEGDYAVKVAYQYSLTRFIPEKAVITLSARSMELDTCRGFTEQGHPFYSGSVTYGFQVDVPADFGEAVLRLPQVRDICTVRVDGREVGTAIYAPYDVALGKLDGSHKLEITVANTMANELEAYCAPSGLLSGGSIHKVQ